MHCYLTAWHYPCIKVTTKPSKEKNTRLAQVYVKGTSIHVEVSTTWYVDIWFDT